MDSSDAPNRANAPSPQAAELAEFAGIEITAGAIWAAVTAIPKHSGGLCESPLLRTAAVKGWIRRRYPYAHKNLVGAYREAALIAILRELVWEKLVAGHPQPTRATSEQERAIVDAGLRLTSERRQWAALYAQYLTEHDVRRDRDEIGQHLGRSDRRVGQLQVAILETLATQLQTLEQEAVSDLYPYEFAVMAAENADVDRVDLRPDVLAALRTRLREAIRAPGSGEAFQEDDLQRLIFSSVRDESEYRLARYAQWVLPRYRLDERFVKMSLFLDVGSDSLDVGSNSLIKRWEEQEARVRDLWDVLEEVDSPVVILLGASGTGKSTILRHFELLQARQAIRGDEALLTYYLRLNAYQGPNPDGMDSKTLPDPEDWIADQWQEHYSELAPIAELLEEGRVVLLLDGLNEMRFRDMDDYAERRDRWRDYLQHFARHHGPRGNRLVISCRAVEDASVLSTPVHRFPYVHVAELSDEAIQRVLGSHSQGRLDERWGEIQSAPLYELLRVPFFLRLYIEHETLWKGIPSSRASLLTDFLRGAVNRERERKNPHFVAGLLTPRIENYTTDFKTDPSPPAQGPLFPRLATLACQSIQDPRPITWPQAVTALGGGDEGDTILRAGRDLGVLDGHPGLGELRFAHDLYRDYFAGLHLATNPQPELARQAWRHAEVTPKLEGALAQLEPADQLPLLPDSPWAEAMHFAACMSRDTDGFLDGLSRHNQSLAGACMDQPEVRRRLSANALISQLDHLVDRATDPEADLRERIHCGRILGHLGDPRFKRRRGPVGEYLAAPLVQIPAAEYVIGINEPIAEVDGDDGLDEMPEHRLALGPFLIGKFPITNAEWRCFMEAGGYEDDRWWNTPTASAWQQGEGTMAGTRANMRYWRDQHRSDPEWLHQGYLDGQIPKDEYELGVERAKLDDVAYEALLLEICPDELIRQPLYWEDQRLNSPVQPVVGICWYEARAYCGWLSAQLDRVVRLPSEVEWEACARGLMAVNIHIPGHTIQWRATISNSSCVSQRPLASSH